MELRVKKLYPNAKLPTKTYDTDAGFDLYALENTILYPVNDTNGLEVTKIRTGIAIEIPLGFYGQIKDKSSVATELGLICVAGVIDCTYRGEVIVCMLNTSGRIVELEAGQKIAQLVILPAPAFTIVEIDKLTKTQRDTDGFGSTGKF